mgnify:FL=1
MTFTFEGKTIHYERHGEGPPLLLLNGIMMSTASWAPFVAPFTRDGHSLLLVDLMDQGQSAAWDRAYTMADQANMLAALLDSLHLPTVSVLGTSYGGALALQFASTWPQRVDRLLLAATRAYTDPLFAGMCESWLHAVHSPQAYYSATIPLFYGATFQQTHTEWMNERRRMLEATAFADAGFLARMSRLTRSIMAFDLREQIGRITCPTLILAPEEDLVMMPWEQRRIRDGIPGAQLLTMPATGHVLFLERPELFVSITMGWFGHRDAVSGI